MRTGLFGEIVRQMHPKPLLRRREDPEKTRVFGVAGPISPLLRFSGGPSPHRD